MDSNITNFRLALDILQLFYMPCEKETNMCNDNINAEERFKNFLSVINHLIQGL